MTDLAQLVFAAVPAWFVNVGPLGLFGVLASFVLLWFKHLSRARIMQWMGALTGVLAAGLLAFSALSIAMQGEYRQSLRAQISQAVPAEAQTALTRYLDEAPVRFGLVNLGLAGIITALAILNLRTPAPHQRATFLNIFGMVFLAGIWGIGLVSLLDLRVAVLAAGLP